MHKKIEMELYDETLLKLEKLASELGVTREELINRSIKELLDETEQTDHRGW